MTPPDTPRIWRAVAGQPGPWHVVLVHGSLDRSAGLLKLSRRLDDRFTVARYDRRGYGRSHPHDGPFGIEAQVGDLVDVVAATRPTPETPCAVVGHSYGGNVGLATADRHPGLLGAVVTYETPLSWLPWWYASGGADALEWQDDPAEAAERFLRSLIGDERWHRLPPATRAARRAEGVAMIGELSDLRRRPPWQADRVGVPVVCLYGEHAHPVHRRGAHVLADLLPRATAGEIAGARHFGPNTHPDAVADRIARFLDAI